MRSIINTALAGLAGGLAASLAMNLYQAAAGPLVGAGPGNEDPATVKAADDVKHLVGAEPVTQKHRAVAGTAVHYLTGAALGVGYALLARRWPAAATGYGTAFGVAVSLVLDDVVVPAAGWGSSPLETPAPIHVYALSSHVVFGVVLEGMRQAATATLEQAGT